MTLNEPLVEQSIRTLYKLTHGESLMHHVDIFIEMHILFKSYQLFTTSAYDHFCWV